ncbi:MAG TPA: glycosyltransferase family 2 protein [Jiangellaceae bacterium]|nr:glycosyltransferase family 2 protein [Jiangellaceae bacterium]
MEAPAPRDWPPISVIMPVRDEERHLAEAVNRVLDQDYPGGVEVVLAVGPSRDRTAEIAVGLTARDRRVRIVDNPAGRTPNGLNAAIAAARHGIVVRVDGHGLLSPGYIRRAVEVLQESGAANVGGIMQAEGQTDFERAVARAMTSPLGVGGARFHLGGKPGSADTVYLGVFRREVLERLGGYDEHFVRAQDWELNYRIRQAGETVWFTPDLVVTYRPRHDLWALARQFFRTGQWRRELIRQHPDTASPRYVAAPATAAAIAVGSAAGLVAAAGGPGWLAIGWLAPAGYAAGIVVASLVEGRGLPLRARAWLPAVLATMHTTWGAGFLVGSRPASGARAGAPAPSAKRSEP